VVSQQRAACSTQAQYAELVPPLKGQKKRRKEEEKRREEVSRLTWLSSHALLPPPAPVSHSVTQSVSQSLTQSPSEVAVEEVVRGEQLGGQVSDDHSEGPRSCMASTGVEPDWLQEASAHLAWTPSSARQDGVSIGDGVSIQPSETCDLSGLEQGELQAQELEVGHGCGLTGLKRGNGAAASVSHQGQGESTPVLEALCSSITMISHCAGASPTSTL